MFCKRHVLLSAVISVLLLAFGFSSTAFAQPDQKQLDELTNTIKQLQKRLEKITDENQSKANDRVTSIGMQRDPENFGYRKPATREIQFYDLSDIFGFAPQYFASGQSELDTAMTFPHSSTTRAGGGFGGGGFGGGGGGVFSMPSTLSPKPTPQDSDVSSSLSMQSIVGVIENTIDKKIWQEPDTSISIIGKGLLVNAPRTTHEKVTRLFDLFRSQWGSLRTVSVQAYWIRLSPAELNDLINCDASIKIQKQKGVSTIDDKIWTDFFKKATDEKRISLSSVITAHNAQTAHAISGRQPRFVTNVESEFSEVAERAPAQVKSWLQFSQIQEGLTFQTTPIATRGGNYVVLDLHCRIVDEKKSSKTAANAKDDAYGAKADLENEKRMIDKPDYTVQRLSTTVRCPVGHFVLAGGMTSPNAIGTETENGQLYLFVRTSVFNVVPDESDRLTKGATKPDTPQPTKPQKKKANSE